MVAEVMRALEHGRGLAYYERLEELAGQARARWSTLLSAPPSELALTAGTTDGIARTLALVPWRDGDEVVISDEEHPGVTGPAGALQRRLGVTVRTAPLDDLASAVTSRTRLVLASHVGWLSGRVLDVQALSAAGVPIVLDGAQSAAAIPVAPRRAARAWRGGLCRAGPEVVVRAGRDGHPVGRSRVGSRQRPWRLAHVREPRRSVERPRRRVLAGCAPVGCAVAVGRAARGQRRGARGAGVCRLGAGARAGPTLAARVAAELEALGLELLPRGHSTLVTWHPSDAAATVAAGVSAACCARLPGAAYVRGVRSVRGRPTSTWSGCSTWCAPRGNARGTGRRGGPGRR